MSVTERSTTTKILGWTLAGAACWAACRLVRTLRGISFEGKHVLVTGGSRGLGLVLAREFLGEGARVTICARDAEELHRALLDLVPRGSVLALKCDVTESTQVHEMATKARRQMGEIDVLVNNAGAISMGPIESATLGDFDEMMRAHFWGPLYAMREVLPSMIRRGGGRIVNIASIGGKIAVPHLTPYSASKFALVGLSEGLQAELGRHGVAVTTVCPGLMRTGSPPNATFKGKHREEYAWFSISASLPLVTISAERAARQIIGACKRGDAEVILSLPARIAAIFHGVCPGITVQLLGLANRLLPGPGGIGTARRTGRESSSWLSPSILTALSEQAGVRNNELSAID